MLVWICNGCNKVDPVNNKEYGSEYEEGDWEPCTYCDGTARVKNAK